MQQRKNKTLEVTFTIRESLYYQFKLLCKAKRKMPAAVIKELILGYVEEENEKTE